MGSFELNTVIMSVLSKKRLFKAFVLSTLITVFFKVSFIDEMNMKASETTAKKETVILTDKNFEANISKGVTLVDFWASWCGPCRMQGPVVDEVAKTFKGKAKVAKLDVDKNKKISAKYHIRSLPTIIIYKDGKVQERLKGYTTKSTLESTLKRYL